MKQLFIYNAVHKTNYDSWINQDASKKEIENFLIVAFYFRKVEQ
jgi:hypothetical protein